MKKNFISLLLVMFPLLTNAAVEINGIYYDYDTTTKEATVTEKWGGYNDNHIVIPETITIDGVKYSITRIGSHAFRNSYMLTVTIPNSVTRIEQEAFSECGVLYSVILGNNVTTIGDGAFAWCGHLQSINIPNSVTTIEHAAFYESGLHYIIIPSNVTTIGSSAFAGCKELTTITFSNDAKSIEGEYPFHSCSSLKQINIPTCTPPSCSDELFWGINLEKCVLNIPIGSEAAYRKADVWKDFENMHERSKVNGIYYHHGTAQEEVSVTRIPDDPTDDDKYIGDIVIPETINIEGTAYCVTSIENEAFANCNALRSISIPKTVSSIGKDAFHGCNSLTHITCLAPTPPSCKSDAFNGGIYCYSTLFVPYYSSVSAYKDTEPWRYFYAIKWIEDDRSSFIQTLTNQSERHADTNIYGLNGLHLNHQQKGLNIVKMNDGTVKKVMKK